MKEFFSILLSITDFGPEQTVWCRVYEWAPGESVSTVRNISHDEARRLMWEMKLAGAHKTTSINQFNPRIHTTDVRLDIQV